MTIFLEGLKSYYILTDFNKLPIFFVEIIESPKDEADANSVNYMKDHYLSCTNLSEFKI